ncbi:MAG: hypothetical protein ACI4OR_04290 [Alphaproteobacteria bacterium]
MKKILSILMVSGIVLSACSYNSKQPTDNTYYKQTQGIAWPEEKKTTAKLVSSASSSGAVGMAAPAMPEKKLQCIKTDKNSYTCRLGQYKCGTGCQADGSNCYSGYCLQSDCDNVMGQKWDLVYRRRSGFYVCQHPTLKISCGPDGGVKMHCWDANGYSCGYDCNKNGTQCAKGRDNCWAKYQDVN